MELFELNGRVVVDLADALKAFDKMQQEGQKTESKMSKVFSGIGKAAVAVGKTVATGLAAAGVAMGTLTIKALNLSGELEQNMGGSEAVFGEYAKSMQDTATQAFENMGLSTSNYLATANKMGALFKGAGFETKEAMDITSQAMQRAADVASIMGIDTEAAMESIAGAAKGNFTMMDNLGVAMNDTTLNAYAMEKGLNKTTQEMTNQEKIGLAMEMFMEKTAYAAGNYAKENQTLAGSLGTAKAALTNFLDGSGDVDQLVSAFSNAATVIVDNVQTIAPRLVSGITSIINKVIPMLPPLLNQLLPSVIEGAVSLLNGVVSALPSLVDFLVNSALPQLVNGAVTIVNALITALPSLLGSVASALPSLLPLLIDGLVSMIVTLCSNFSAILQPIIDNLPSIIVSIVSALVSNLPLLIQGVISLILGIVSAIPQIIQGLVDATPEVISLLIESILSNLPLIISGLIQLVLGITAALGSIFVSLNEGIINTFIGIFNGIKNVFAPIVSWFGGLFGNAKEAIQKAWSTVKNWFANIWTGIKNVFSSVGSWFRDKFNTAKNNVQNAFSGIKNFFSNIKNGIVSAFSNIKEKLSEPFTKARDKIKEIADKIKGFFKGEISMPKIKTPKFSIKPEGWKIGDLLDGKIPKLGITWHADAVKNPMILREPTIFGYNSATGKFHGAGETAESEVVSGTNTLMSMIENAVEGKTNAQSERIISLLTALLNAIVGGNQELLQALLAGQKIVIDEREFARTVKKYA